MTSNTSKTAQMQGKFARRSRNRTLLSCTECHRRKQKCNRNHPCNDCLQRGVPHKCHFVVPSRRDLDFGYQATKDARGRRIRTGEEVLLSPESVEDLRGARPAYASTRTPIDKVLFHPTPTAGIVGRFDSFSALTDTTEGPLPKSILLEYFINQLAPWLGSYDDAQIPGRPAFSWLPFALHHPPLLNATLLSAAVHLDRKQPMDKRTLVWYKIETIRLASETMNIPVQAATDEMLLVVLILLYFNVGGGNGEEYEMHLSGINQMLIIRGGMDSLGMRRMIKNWLGICYGPWNNDWHYGNFVDLYGIKRKPHA